MPTAPIAHLVFVQAHFALGAPPLDKTARDPGYIKGYPPGIRENGGQYTHGAIWTVWTYAQLDDGARAGRLFDLLNPINHSSTAAQARCYRAEPYVVAADVYGVAPHVGRGGLPGTPAPRAGYTGWGSRPFWVHVAVGTNSA